MHLVYTLHTHKRVTCSLDWCYGTYIHIYGLPMHNCPLPYNSWHHSLLAGHEVEHLVHKCVEVLHFLAVDTGRALNEQGCLREVGGSEAGIKGDRESISLHNSKHNSAVIPP